MFLLIPQEFHSMCFDQIHLFSWISSNPPSFMFLLLSLSLSLILLSLVYWPKIPGHWSVTCPGKCLIQQVIHHLRNLTVLPLPAIKCQQSPRQGLGFVLLSPPPCWDLFCLKLTTDLVLAVSITVSSHGPVVTEIQFLPVVCHFCLLQSFHLLWQHAWHLSTLHIQG